MKKVVEDMQAGMHTPFMRAGTFLVELVFGGKK